LGGSPGWCLALCGVPTITFPCCSCPQRPCPALRAGMSYKELLRDQILAPLGVTMTGITLHAAAGDDAALRPAHDDRSALMPRWDFGALAASGAMFRAPPTYLRPHLRARRPTASGRPDAKLSITGG